MKNYTITVNGTVYDVSVEEKTGAASPAAVAPAPAAPAAAAPAPEQNQLNHLLRPRLQQQVVQLVLFR